MNQVRRVTCRCCLCGVEDVSPLYIDVESESDLVEAQGTRNKEEPNLKRDVIVLINDA